MKSLIVYIKDSFYRYDYLWERHVYVCDDILLRIDKRDEATGEQSEVACFKTWDYFIVEEN